MNVCTKFPLSRYNEANAWKMARFDDYTDEAGAFENYSLSVIRAEKIRETCARTFANAANQ